jgi:hypothetical protein
MVKVVFNPVILSMALAAIDRIPLRFVIGCTVELNLMAGDTCLGCGCHITFVTLRALNNRFMGSF